MPNDETMRDYWQLPPVKQEAVKQEVLTVVPPETLSEYCWQHVDVEGGGGWTCGVCMWLLYGK